MGKGKLNGGRGFDREKGVGWLKEGLVGSPTSIHVMDGSSLIVDVVGGWEEESEGSCMYEQASKFDRGQRHM